MRAGTELRDWLADRDQVAASMKRARQVGEALYGGDLLGGLRRELAALEPRTPDAVMDVARHFARRTDDLSALFDQLTEAAAADPFFLPPLVEAQGDLNSALLLMDDPALLVAIGITPIEVLAAKKSVAPAARSLAFTGNKTLFRFIRAGGATLSFWEAPRLADQFRADAAPPCRFVAERRIEDGEEVLLDGETQTFVIEHATGDILFVQAIVKEAAAPLVVEYDSETLGHVGASSADESASRIQMMVSLLRLMDRQDAAPLIVQALDSPHFHTRWHIMRELLALDAEVALPPLRRMADADPHPEVRAAAAHTLNTFFGDAACPA